MTDTLISILLIGGAITYFIEFLITISFGLLPPKPMYLLLVSPLAYIGLLILDMVDKSAFVLVPAISFVVLFFYLFVIHPPVKVQTINKTNTLDSRRYGL